VTIENGWTKQRRSVFNPSIPLLTFLQRRLLTPEPGGKAKPMKKPKSDKKELDEEDKAFLEKKRAGMHPV
jgi:hypothetical protein